MKNGYALMRGLVYTNPLLLHTLPSKLQSIAEEMMPKSVGIEFECAYNDTNRNPFMFTLLPLLDMSMGAQESKFRIPKGIIGLVTLYKLMELMPEYYAFNHESGIHLHVGSTFLTSFGNDPWGNILVKDAMKLANFLENKPNKNKFRNNIINQLRSWGYTGNFNRPAIGINDKATWVTFRTSFKTIEYRIVNMTFNYTELVKKIIHAQKITRELDSYLMK